LTLKLHISLAHTAHHTRRYHGTTLFLKLNMTATFIQEQLAVGGGSPSIASTTDSSSEADGINDGVWLNTNVSTSTLSSPRSYCLIEFDSDLLIAGENSNDDGEEKELQVNIKAAAAAAADGHDDDFEDPRPYGNRRSGSLRSNFRARGATTRRAGSLSSFLREGTPRVVEDDDSLVRNRVEREKNSRMPSWSDSVLDMMDDDEDCIEVPMKE
jgi:hypothetical protein